ncbi:MAG: hypothetical protein O7C61_11865, partial [SAR324 cluster bacterium]|nr:hypothetical protein [SAR324 cluster bacterium]
PFDSAQGKLRAGETGSAGAFLPSTVLRTGRESGFLAAFLRNELVLSLSKGVANVSKGAAHAYYCDLFQ